MEKVPKRRPLASFAKVQGGFTFKSSDFCSEGIPVVKIKNVTPPTVDVRNTQCVSREVVEGISQVERFIVGQGDILIAMTGATLGKVGRVPQTNQQVLLNQRVGRVDVTNPLEVDHDYLFHVLSYDLNVHLISKMGEGSAQANVSSEEIERLQVPLPPLTEQHRIAAIFTSIDNSTQKTDEILATAQQFKKGLRQQLFTWGIRHTRLKQTEVGVIPEEWELGPVKSYIESIKSGLSRRITSEDIGLPMLTSTNVKDSQLDIQELKYWYKDDPKGANTSNYILQEGDLLLNFINSIGQIGKCCVFHDIGRDAIYTTNLFRLVVNKEKASSEFLNYLINSELVQKQIKRVTKPAINQASFTKLDFESIRVPLVGL